MTAGPVDGAGGAASADGTDPVGYQWRSLTAAIDDQHSPLRRYLNDTYPNTRLITSPHNQASPALAIPAIPGVNPGTVGTAFDLLVALRYQPNTIPVHARPFARFQKKHANGWANIVNLLAEDDTLIEAAAWAYALAIEAFRTGIPPYVIEDLLDDKGGYNEHDLLAIATPDAIETLANLNALAEMNRPGLVGVSIVWKRGWTHAEGSHPWQGQDASLQPR